MAIMMVKEGGKIHELTDMDVQFVSLVGQGANRQSKFLMVKTDQIAKLVPDETATDDEKEDARVARSARYKIEVIAKNSALTYPISFPTTETMYGDPCNLKYPWGDKDNGLDMGRLRNGLSRFKQNYEQYSQAESRKSVYTRLVRQALSQDIEVSYDPEDVVDALLPQDLKDTLSAKVDDVDKGDPDQDSKSDNVEDDAQDQPVDLTEWLDSVGDELDDLSLAGNLEAAQTAKSVNPVGVPDDAPEIDGEAAQSSRDDVLKQEIDRVNRENERQQRALDKQKDALRKAQLHATKLKQSMVGGASGLVTGQVERRTTKTGRPVVSDKTLTRWNSGGDLSVTD